jgi:hypothetical protein
MIVQTKMDASSGHIGWLVHNIIDPHITLKNTRKGCFTKSTSSIMECGRRSCLGKNTLYITLPNGPCWIFHLATNLGNLPQHK